MVGDKSSGAPRKSLTVLVCGGRDFVDRAWLDHVLRFIDRHPEHYGGHIGQIISGGAPGADTLAKEWAEGCGIPYKAFPADWETHGRAAGPIRNQQMLEEGKPDLVIAFPGGRGTADMVRRARAAGIKVAHVIKRPSLLRRWWWPPLPYWEMLG